MILPIVWSTLQDLPSRSYVCGYCGSDVASQKGWHGNSKRHQAEKAFVYICHRCTGATFFNVEDVQTPGAAFGEQVKDVSDKSVSAIYGEARAAVGVNAFTASVLCCRKLLMHIAVAKGAPSGKSFVTYVEFLAENHYVPPDAIGWVDHIRKHGNETNHEIVISSKDDAIELVAFCGMLLKIIYEFPAAVARKAGSPPPAS